MSLPQQTGQNEGLGPVIGHVLKRLLLMFAGYIVALAIGLFAVAAIYGILGSLPDAPSYYVAFELAPLALLLLPHLALLAIIIALISTVMQALLAGLLSEIFSLRNFALHTLFGSLTAVSGFLLIAPVEESGVPSPTPIEYVVMAIAGAIAGFVYWMIAGREAGFRRRSP